MLRNLATFSSTKMTILEKVRLIIWYVFSSAIFEKFWFPRRLRPSVLRIFGANIGNGVIIRREVRVYFPWNLSIGENSWVGEQALIINHELVAIGANACISQRAIISSSSHDLRSSNLAYHHQKVIIKSGVWVCMDSKVLSGSILGENSVVSAGEIFSGHLTDGHIFRNGKSRSIQNDKGFGGI